MTDSTNEGPAAPISAERNKDTNIEAGHKATERKLAQFGPDELKRAGHQAAWTKAHPDADKASNEHLREKVYSVLAMDQARRFANWQKAHPTRCHNENPHAWSRTKLNETI